MNAIIFDVDGTLWDSTAEVARVWSRVAKEYAGIEISLTSERLKKEFGKPMAAIMDSLFPELSEKAKEELAEKLYFYENEELRTAPCVLYPGMKETIRKLSEKYPLCIVSNCQAGYIETFLENTGLSAYFKDHTCPGDTGCLKGENIQIIMERNQIKRAVYVGDTQGDADACREAGIPMIYAAYGFGQVEEELTTIQSFEELLLLDYDKEAQRF